MSAKNDSDGKQNSSGGQCEVGMNDSGDYSGDQGMALHMELTGVYQDGIYFIFISNIYYFQI